MFLYVPLRGQLGGIVGEHIYTTGDTNDAPIVDLNAAQKAGLIVQYDEEVSMRIAWPYIKSTDLLDGFKNRI